ncbi:MAG: hypothetical protein WCL27_18950 [Betaproteobacteria bacterium]
MSKKQQPIKQSEQPADDEPVEILTISGIDLRGTHPRQTRLGNEQEPLSFSPPFPKNKLQLADDVASIWIDQIPDAIARAIYSGDDIGARAVQITWCQSHRLAIIEKTMSAIREGRISAVNPYRIPSQLQTDDPGVMKAAVPREFVQSLLDELLNPPTAGQKLEQPQTVAQQSEHAPFKSESDPSTPPWKMPKVAIGKLAVSAAWQIECETGRAASNNAVIDRLKEWATNGKYADVLIKPVSGERAVIWLTSTGIERKYDSDTCRKTLETWRKSRKQT